jgi:hypothetical protein
MKDKFQKQLIINELQNSSFIIHHSSLLKLKKKEAKLMEFYNFTAKIDKCCYTK